MTFFFKFPLNISCSQKKKTFEIDWFAIDEGVKKGEFITVLTETFFYGNIILLSAKLPIDTSALGYARDNSCVLLLPLLNSML